MSAPFVAPASTTSLVLNPDGHVVEITPGARHLLDLDASDAAPLGESFLSLVHRHNAREVARDLSDMKRFAKRRAGWLLRLRTGRRVWRWAKATATNLLDSSGAIRVELVAVAAF